MEIPLPNEEGRHQILTYETDSLRQVFPKAIESAAEEFLFACAGLTDGFSGADLAGLVRAAKLKALFRAVKKQQERHHVKESADLTSEVETLLQHEDLYDALYTELERRGEEDRCELLSKKFHPEVGHQ